MSKLFAVSGKTIAAWANDGIVTRVSRGRFDLPSSIQSFAKHEREQAKRDGGETIATQVGSERARLLKAQADRAEMQLAVERKQLVPQSEGAACAFALCHIFRGGMLAFKTRLAGRLGLSREGIETVREEACAILQEISDMNVYSERLGDVAQEAIEKALAKGDIAAPFVRAA